MDIRQDNLYHPYTRSFLGIVLKANSSPENIWSDHIEDVNLYFQPLPHPTIAAMGFVLKLLLVVLGEFVYIKILTRIKNDDTILNDITRLYVRMQMVFQSLSVLFMSINDFIHPLSEVIGQWYCSLGWFAFEIGSKFIAFHSFSTALMRYVFIFHQNKVENYGKEKTKLIFYYLSVAIPFIISIMNLVQAHEVGHRSFINKCYGTHHKAFLLDTSPFRSVQRTFWNPEDYESKGFWNFALAITRRVFKICTTCVSLLATSNLTEAFLYYKIISYMNRYYENRICVSIG